MKKSVKDYTLLDRTIATLMGVQELRAAQCGNAQAASRPIKAPSTDDLDFGDSDAKQASPKPAPVRKHGKVKPEGPPRPVEHDETAKPSLVRKAARLVAYLLVMASAVAVNEFYGYPLRGSRWLKFETYRTATKNFFESKEYTVTDSAEGTKTMNITGIAYSSEKPAAMIGGRIVHVGDVVADVTIIRIGPKEIVFKSGDHTWTEKVH